MKKPRYFFERDDTGQWYLVDDNYRFTWLEWKKCNSNDPKTRIEPFYVERLIGDITDYTFKSPRKDF